VEGNRNVTDQVVKMASCIQMVWHCLYFKSHYFLDMSVMWTRKSVQNGYFSFHDV